MSLDISLKTTVTKQYEHSGETITEEVWLFDANATHNLVPMWREANVCSVLYDMGGKIVTDEHVSILKVGLSDMKKNKEKYILLEPSNGWGNYDGAVNFLERVYKAFAENVNAVICVSQ